MTEQTGAGRAAGVRVVRAAGLTLAACFALAAGATAAPPPVGELAQLEGDAGCWSRTGLEGPGVTCSNGRALLGPAWVAVSPDGNNAYVASYGSDAVAIFSRDPATGALSQAPGDAGCISQDGGDGEGGSCIDGRFLSTASGVAVSPDGKSVYVASASDNGVAVLNRDTATGALSQASGPAGCISESGATCVDGKGLSEPYNLTVSPDGRTVYAGSINGKQVVAVLQRDPTSGALTQDTATPAGCISQDGSDGAGNASACVDGKGLGQTVSVAVSPDGRNVYVASDFSNAVAILTRDAATGALTQDTSGTAGCVSYNGSDGAVADQCADGKGLQGAYAVAVSPDGANVYVGSITDDSVATFSRDPATGALAQATSGTGGCISQDGTDGEGDACLDGKGLLAPQWVVASPDGATVYAGSQGSSAIAVLPRDPSTGSLSQRLSSTLGCVSQTGTDGDGQTCLDGKGLGDVDGLAASSDGKSVYAASDGSDAVAILSRELAPVCADTSQSLAHNTAATVQLLCSDPNGGPVTRSIVSVPAQGVLGPIDESAGSIAYSPGAGFAGTDSFTFRASDGTNDSNTASAGLTVSPPVAPLLPGTLLGAGRCSNRVSGTNRSNRLFGTSAGDRILGLRGNDLIRGLLGDDCLEGGAGHDRLYGDAGDDRLLGGGGRDRLQGGAGADALYGGSGNDVISGGKGKDAFSGGSGRDRISSRDGRRERVNCGPGKDSVNADRNDRLVRCERRRRS